MAARVIRRVIIRGRVQGIGYRAWTESAALARGLEGWVRNCRDGAVEAVFAGPDEQVAAMIGDCRNGPSGARVTALDVTEMDEIGANPQAAAAREGAGARFSILPTA